MGKEISTHQGEIVLWKNIATHATKKSSLLCPMDVTFENYQSYRIN